MVKMENNINEYKYGDSVEDLKLKAFVDMQLLKIWIQTLSNKRHL